MTKANRELSIPVGDINLRGLLEVAPDDAGIVVFVHGSGSSRLSPRNQRVAGFLREGRLGTLLFDLLTPEEEQVDAFTRQLRFDIELLTQRLLGATDWLVERSGANRPFAYFGASTGAAAALIAATRTRHSVSSVVSRGGRPDLAGSALAQVRAPTLLIVGGNDPQVLELNRLALGALDCEKHLAIVPGATHLFEEPGTLRQAAALARDWLVEHFEGNASDVVTGG